MENSQTNVVQKEVSEETPQFLLTKFESEEEMKAYYLQMMNVIRVTHSNPSIDSEYERFKKLSSKFNQYKIFFQALSQHKWETGIAEVQRAVGIYMMQNIDDTKMRRQINQEIASLLQFIVYISGNIHIIKQFQGIINTHLVHIHHLLTSYPEDSQKPKE